MENKQDTRTKKWLCWLRSLKNYNRKANDAVVLETVLTPGQSPNHHANIPLNETSPELRRSGVSFRRSLRKWHKRMKTCFSNNRQLNSQRQPIQQTSSLVSRRQSCEKQNLYTLEPALERKLTTPVEDEKHSSTTAIVGSPSRLSDIQQESQPVSTSPAANCTPKDEITSLAQHVWYWGPAPKSLVEAKLEGKPDGTFLVRDSASERYVFSISFRSVGKTLHSRIEHTNSGYKVFDHRGFDSVIDLIENALKVSEEGLYCYTRSRGQAPNYPVRLLKPISRYQEVRSLQNLARFVIRQHINLNDIDKLSLPPAITLFLKEEFYF